MLSFSKDTLSYSENVIICWKICEKTVKPWSNLFVFRRKINFFYHKNHVYYEVSADGHPVQLCSAAKNYAGLFSCPGLEILGDSMNKKDYYWAKYILIFGFFCICFWHLDFPENRTRPR